MNTTQPSIDTSTSLSDWLEDAVDLVQRVNDRLRGAPPRRQAPQQRHGRRVLSDQRCLELAGLALPDVAVAAFAG